jgi:hypothetical protein
MRSSQSAVSWIPQAAELTGSAPILTFSQSTDKYLSSSHFVSCTRYSSHSPRFSST